MRLKRVKIFGFKTFADRTEFNIEGGVVAVVGPNGCGKSNLVDAILWGLGEANARNLRATSSQDVIFSGSSRRKSIGFAEVSLLFDNSDGDLPVPTSEVTITRRLTRSGESEYLINRQACRQRDVYELLADSGLGRSGYAIVGQKEIDQALSASAEERRAWVDEAAGVVRYRTRKQDAERRLAAARSHLERVEDVLRELEVQREPLRQEAEIARAYKSVLDSLRAVEQGMLVREVAGAVAEVEQARISIERTTGLIAEENVRAEKLDIEVRAIGETVSELEREMDAVRGLQQSSLTAIERSLAEVRLAEERLRGLDQIETALKEESGSLFNQLKEAGADLEAAQQEEAAESATLTQLKSEAQGADAERLRLRKTLEDAEAQLREGRKLQQQRMRQETEAEHRRERMALLHRELLALEEAVPKTDNDACKAGAEHARLSAELTKARDQFATVEAEIVKCRGAEASDSAELRKLLTERATFEGRRRGIEATLETFEGMPQGPRSVLEAAQRGLLRGRYVAVANAITAPKEMALAFETALGGAAHDLITDHDQDAKAAIAYLKENRLGRATFQPVSLMRPNEDERIWGLQREPGVLGVASELCEYADADRPVIESLLGRVLVVDKLDMALRLAKTKGWKHIVTLEGEIVHSSGAVTGGTQSKGHYGMLQRKADLAQIESEMARVHEQASSLEARIAGHKQNAEEAALHLQSVKGDLLERSEVAAEAQELARTLRREHEEALKSQGKLQREIAGLREVEKDLTPEVDLAPLESIRDQALEALNRHTSLTEQSSELLIAAETRLRQTEQRRKQAERRVSASQEADEKRKARLKGLGPERNTILSAMDGHGRAKSEAERKAHEAGARLQQLQETRSNKLQRSLELAEEASAARKNAVALAESLHAAELARARADSRRANALQRLIEEYSLDEADALAQADATEVPADAPQLVSRLRRELKGMGDVNLGAIEAFERLSERWDDLTVQRDDVLGGIQQVQESIGQLDQLTRERFLDTFRKLEVTFSEFFEKLFGGGEGKVRLSDAEALLDSGIELDVTLPGKKRQPLALLSGGERSLCGVAFLFGLLQIKPSPLVVLDEVDAPLDGRNVERFADLLREFTDRVQFIVITHNHATIVRADVFLGVSMQEPGVSILVPVRLPGREVQPEFQFAVVESETITA